MGYGTRKKNLLIGLGILALCAVAIGFYFYSPFSTPHAPPTAPNSTVTAPPALTQAYKNSRYNFSLMMPADFAASESQDPSSGADTVLLQNKTGDGIQIVVSPFSEDKPPYSGYTLTEERIHQDLPDLAIAEPEPVPVGTEYVGIAFKSDNLAFDGASREVWFVFHGNLYQISTYARLDPLLQAIFKTWHFN